MVAEELTPRGGATDPSIGGTAKSQVAVQCIADYAGATQAQVAALITSCKAMATALGASSADQTSADAAPAARDRAKAWCALAAARIGTTKSSAGGTLALQYTPAACKLAVAKKLACQARCAGTATCDETTNPVRCTGGTLSGGFCQGGKLEGGCKVEAKCDADCDVSVVAAADCPTTAVTVNTSNAANATAAATLKSALEASLPSLFATKAHLELEANYASVVTGNADAIVDIKVACIPRVIASAQEAVSDDSAGVSASADVSASVQ